VEALVVLTMIPISLGGDIKQVDEESQLNNKEKIGLTSLRLLTQYSRCLTTRALRLTL
jgi:hypothetical protein